MGNDARALVLVAIVGAKPYASRPWPVARLIDGLCMLLRSPISPGLSSSRTTIMSALIRRLRTYNGGSTLGGESEGLTKTNQPAP